MAASSILQKLLKKPSFPPPSLKALTSFPKLQLPNSPLPPFLPQIPIPIPTPDPDPSPVPIFQSFPHWFNLEPISIHGLDRSDGEVGPDEEDRTVIRADSVKKKRKRKMNKHKLKKLRKRLRRQT